MSLTMLRMTHWPSPDQPTTVALSAEDMVVTPTQAVEDMLHDGPPGFFTWEIFEAETNEFVEAVLIAQQKANERAEHERNMAILYFYDGAILPMMTEKGVVGSKRAAPFDEWDASWVLRCLMRHPAYRNQSIYVPLENGKIVSVVDGDIATRTQED